MSNLRNSVRLIGHLGQNPEMKELTSGRKLAKFSLATNETYKNESGEKVVETQWHTITVWGKLADLAAKLLKKGSEVAIEGKLNNRSYLDREGIKRYSTDIVLNEFVLIGGKKD